MKAYFVRIKQDHVTEGENPFVGIFLADTLVGLGIAIDQQQDPDICEAAEIEISAEGIFLEAASNEEGEDFADSLRYCGVTEGLQELLDSMENMEWYDLGDWSKEYIETLSDIIAHRDTEEGFYLNAQRIAALYPMMSHSEKQALAIWESENITGDGQFTTSDWPGWDAVFKRLSH
jgi:hypothetical protein